MLSVCVGQRVVAGSMSGHGFHFTTTTTTTPSSSLLDSTGREGDYVAGKGETGGHTGFADKDGK